MDGHLWRELCSRSKNYLLRQELNCLFFTVFIFACFPHDVSSTCVTSQHRDTVTRHLKETLVIFLLIRDLIVVVICHGHDKFEQPVPK